MKEFFTHTSEDVFLITDVQLIQADFGCMWFRMCENGATGTVKHPVLGDVPVCDRCAEFASGGA
jgi:hypothetical protein